MIGENGFLLCGVPRFHDTALVRRRAMGDLAP
jgi:hypothetical protein